MSSSRYYLGHIRRLSTAAATNGGGSGGSGSGGGAGSSMTMSKAISKLRTEYDPDKALEIYSSVAKLYGSHPSSRFAHDLTVRRLAKCRRFTDIENLIESHKKNRKVKQEPYLATLIRSYGRSGMFDQALKTFEEMDKLGTPRSAVSFSAILSACIDSKLFEKARSLFDEIPERYNVQPDKVSYGILVKSYCESGMTDKAVEILKEMETKGVEVTAVTFTTVLESLYRNGKTNEAEDLWSEMVKNGCKLDSAAYNVRIMNVQGKNLDTVKQVIEEMKNSGLKPDTITYNYLIAAYCKSGMIDDAMTVYEGLEDNGLKPNQATFRSLISHLCSNDLYEEGYKVFRKGVSVRKTPDINTLKPLVEGLVKKKKFDDANGMLRVVKKRSPKMSKEMEETLKSVSASAGDE